MSASTLAFPPLLISVEQATSLTGLSRSYLYEMLACNAFVSRKIGRRRMIELESLQNWQKSFTANEGLTMKEAH